MISAGGLFSSTSTRLMGSTGMVGDGLFGVKALIAEPPLASPAAWYKFNTGITVTGAGVSQWDDKSGNSRPLLQATDASRPAKQGDGSILFDGTNDYLKTATFTLGQPWTLYMLFKQVTSPGTFDYVIDGNTQNTGAIYQGNSSGQLQSFAFGGFGPAVTTPLDQYVAIAMVFNQASSTLQYDDEAAATGTVNAGSANGFTLAAHGGVGSHSNLQVKEILIYAGAHDATQRTTVLDYLQGL